jgi:hypothetical protein
MVGYKTKSIILEKIKIGKGKIAMFGDLKLRNCLEEGKRLNSL